MSRILCSECHVTLSVHAESCHACGYPVVANGQPAAQTELYSGTAPFREYRLMQMTGIALSCAGFASVLADEMLIAGVSVTLGIATYMTGLLGTWWNSAE